MFIKDSNDVGTYTKLMMAIKLQNRNIKKLESSKEYRIGKMIHKSCNLMKKFDYSSISKEITKMYYSKKVGFKYKHTPIQPIELSPADYFSREKIAIYTVIIGSYDKLEEPIFVPDNCDFFVVTDKTIKEKSVWKKIDVNYYRQYINGLNSIEINRYFKMHPTLLFDNYNYSIYLDGNIQPVSDLTEFVNRIGRCGIAAHRHCFRNCVYDEGAVLKCWKKDNPERIEQHLAYLREQKMPCNYGLIECNVIARRHHDPICIAVMDDWWNEFMSQSKRDQLSFPHALYKNNISVDEVATLGNNVFENDAIRKYSHLV